MGRTYNIPPDINEKEKVVGGVLTLQQTIYLVIGAGLGATLFLVSFFLLNIYVGLVLFLLTTFSIGPILAFKHIDGFPFDKYLILSRNHKKHGRRLPYKRTLG